MSSRDLDKRIVRVLNIIERVRMVSKERGDRDRGLAALTIPECIAVAAIVDREESAFDLEASLPGAGRGY
jgi:hypothetical protein